MNDFDYLFKFIIIGDISVGKSCIMLNFVNGDYRGSYDPTLGVEFGSKNINIAEKVIKIQIWDTAGQESFKSITRSYYKGSIAALIVYDITRRQTFNNLKRWLTDIQELSNEHIQVIVCGNKKDLDAQREVSYEEGQQFSQKNGFLFAECSAKTGYNINEIFMQMSAKILGLVQTNKIDLQNCYVGTGIKVGNRSKQQEQIILKETKLSNSEKKNSDANKICQC